MDNDKLNELLETRAQADQELEKMRSAVTILFSDIKGSTEYFEKKGDHEGLAMVQRHNSMLIPVIEECGGRVVKTIGDAIMACFDDPVGAVRAAIGMQRALESDRTSTENAAHIHIRVGLHTGLGLVKDNDVYGDVVNTASRVQHQAEPDQILITDVLLEAAQTAGVQCARLFRAEMRGKDERIDVYAVAWSFSVHEQLIEELQVQFDRRLKDAKQRQEELEEEFETSRDQWRNERRRLSREIEELEEAVELAKQGARQQVSEDLQAEIRFQLEEAVRGKQQVEQELVSMQVKWELERNNFKAHIALMQGAALEAMERSNNPTRLALAVREQVDARLKEAKKDWELQWDGERRRLSAEIERLKKAGNVDEKREQARRAVLEKLGKLPPGAKTAAQWEQDFESAKIQWETERDQLNNKVQQLERDAKQGAGEIRTEIFQELRNQYEPKIAQADREKQRLEAELETLATQATEERQRLATSIEQLESAIPEAQEAVRKQVTAELSMEYEGKVEELNRLKGRSERRFQDSVDEWEAERRRLRKQIAQFEEHLKEAREAAFKAQRSGTRPSPAESEESEE